MLRTTMLLRRPVLPAAALASVLCAGAAGFVAAAQPPAATASETSTSRLTPADPDADRAARSAAVARDDAASLAAQREAARVEAELQAAAEAVRIELERQAAEAAAAREANERASRDAARDPRGLARIMVAERGWSTSEFDCLDRLWEKESNWNPSAANPTSSAYGIPQALPGSKMSSAGDDWRTNPATQIEWGLGYIEDRYGTPCSAWSHSRSNNWY